MVYNQTLSATSPIRLDVTSIVPSANNLFHASAFIDFDSNNRISFLVLNGGNVGEKVALAFFENGVVRCAGSIVGCVGFRIDYDVFSSSPHNIRLEYYPDTNIVIAFIDNEELAKGVFAGDVSDMQIGFAGMAFERDDYIDLRFDDFKITATIPTQYFDLPFDYPSRPNATKEQFKDAFWEPNRLTAAFDHERKGKYHIPFTTEQYKPNDCKWGTIGIECCNGHTGIDFDDRVGEVNGQNAYSVATVKLFTHPHTQLMIVHPTRVVLVVW